MLVVHFRFMEGKGKGKAKYSEFLAVRIDPELRAAIERLAEKEERPAGMMARILLREAVAAREIAEKGTKRNKRGEGKEQGR